MNPFIFNSTPSIVFGVDTAKNIGELAMQHLGDRVLLVTDAGLVKAGLVDPTVASMNTAGIEVKIYDQTVADPPEALVLQATQAARDFGTKGVLGLGGGSSLDIAKLVAVLSNSETPIADIYGINQIQSKRLPLVLVPTTAGTGSEVTPISIITTGKHEKKGVVSPVLLPDVAVLDPALTLGLPAPITAATGVDAMVHAIEAYASANPNNNPVSRGLAIQALQLLSDNITVAVKKGADLSARSAMLLGSLLAGQAFANSPVAAVHALAYPLGGHYGISHGLSNALVLSHVIRFNARTAPRAYAEIVSRVFPDLRGKSDTESSTNLVTFLEELTQVLGLPSRLRELNIPESDCMMLAREAMKQSRLLVNNPRTVTQDDAYEIYRAAW